MKRLQLINIICDTTNTDQHRTQINEHTKQDKPKTNKNSKINLQSSNKIHQEVEYFIAGPDMEADTMASAKIMQGLSSINNNVFARNQVLQRHLFIM